MTVVERGIPTQEASTQIPRPSIPIKPPDKPISYSLGVDSEAAEWHRKYSSPSLHFTGYDPEGDEKIRQARNKEFQKEKTLAEIKKVIEPGLSPLEAIEKALQDAKRRNHSPLKTDGPFVVLGIQPIFDVEAPTRSNSLASPVRKVVGKALFVAETFETQAEAERTPAQMAYNEFHINRNLIKGPDRSDLSDLVKFYSIDIEELRRETA